MCGIIGISSNKSVSASIISSLKKLEYRGYDSAGIATLVDGHIKEVKCEGRVDLLEKDNLLKKKDEDIQKGKQILNTWLEENDEIFNYADKETILNELLNILKYPNYETIYQNLGNSNIKITNVGNKIRKFVFPEEITEDEDILSPDKYQTTDDKLVIVEGYDDIKVRMARCCVPVPGDDILGFITISNGISIHRSDCLNIKIDSSKGERIIDVSWGFNPQSGSIVWLEIEAIDRPYLLRDATIAISDNGGNILVAKSLTNSKRIVTLLFQVEISGNEQLDSIISDAKNIENVFDVQRVNPGN